MKNLRPKLLPQLPSLASHIVTGKKCMPYNEIGDIALEFLLVVAIKTLVDDFERMFERGSRRWIIFVKKRNNL